MSPTIGIGAHQDGPPTPTQQRTEPFKPSGETLSTTFNIVLALSTRRGELLEAFFLGISFALAFVYLVIVCFLRISFAFFDPAIVSTMALSFKVFIVV